MPALSATDASITLAWLLKRIPSERNREIVRRAWDGDYYTEIAKAFKLSPCRVGEIVRKAEDKLVRIARRG